jgi:hypothetical protein
MSLARNGTAESLFMILHTAEGAGIGDELACQKEKTREGEYWSISC